MKTFASIYIGSYEVTMKVFEISTEKKLKEIDCLRANLDILRDINTSGSVSLETTDRLCEILSDMKKTMKMYRCDNYRIFAGFMLHTAANELFVLEQIRIRVKLSVKLLSNSEHRFLGYEAVASQKDFKSIINEGAVIVDVGGASFQITLFDEGKVVTTQQIMFGTYSLHQSLINLGSMPDYQSQIPILVDKEIDVFIKMYLGDRKPKYMIIMGDRTTAAVQAGLDAYSREFIETKTAEDILKKFLKRTRKAINGEDFSIDLTDNRHMEALILIHLEILKKLNTEYVMLPGITVNDGIAYDYAYGEGLLRSPHDFENDVLSACWSIAERYGSYEPHLLALENFSLQIMDAMKKYHGLSKRHRLLMRCVCILHDCGKYISISEQADCSYAIIESSEILGLSHKERMMVATTVAFNRKDLEPYEAMADRFSEEEYNVIVKLLAILKVANAMDRSHKQKFKSVKMTLKNRQLIISTESDSSAALEKGMFRGKANFFEQTFAIRPVIHEKRVI